jgi:hypothetical protein
MDEASRKGVGGALRRLNTEYVLITIAGLVRENLCLFWIDCAAVGFIGHS